MASFSICLLLIVYTFSTPAMATISLSSEFSKFLPACAETCFISFIDGNFPTSLCSTTPTLDCLCSNNSTSGYTIGEGAVQCILSQDQLGSCKGSDADLGAVVTAFSMCNGQENALPNTHATLTATVFIPTASPSLVLISPGSSTTINTSSSSRAGSTATPRPTNSSSTTSSTSISSTSSSSLSSLSTTSLLTSTASPAEATQVNGTSPTVNQTSPVLSGPEIAGIAVGAAGGAALLASGLLLLLCVRRRRRATRDSDMLPFQTDPASSLKYDRGFFGPTEKNSGPGATATGVAAKVAPPVPARIDTGSPNMFSRRSLRPDTIGLAISPESDTQKVMKKQRPSSKLLPEKPILTLQMPPQNAKARYSRRKSVFNRGSMTRESTGTQFEEDIDSAFEVDDDYRRGSTDKILDNATGIWKPQQSNSNPPIPDFPMPAETRAFHGQPPNTKSIIPDYYIRPLEIGRGRTLGSFSQPRKPESNPQPQLQLQIPPETGRPVTSSSSVYSIPSVAAPSDIGRSLTGGPRLPKSYNQGGPYDFDEPETPTPAERKPTRGELSPVVESPKSPKTPPSATGRSPVSYPRIPKLLSPSTIRMVPPPAQPDFTQVFSSGTIRRAPSRQESENWKPWRQAEVAAQQARAAQQVQQQQQQQQELEQQQQLQQPPPQQYKSYRPPSEHIVSQYNPPSLQPSALSMDFPNRGSSSTISTSSLLAKRRGEKQAAALALKSEDEVRAKWRVLKERDIEAAKSPDWKPQLAKFERTELPNTPGWVPRLTPTRRGDELFLSVQ